jgi:hypothetical protein
MNFVAYPIENTEAYDNVLSQLTPCVFSVTVGEFPHDMADSIHFLRKTVTIGWVGFENIAQSSN